MGHEAGVKMSRWNSDRHSSPQEGGVRGVPSRAQEAHATNGPVTGPYPRTSERWEQSLHTAGLPTSLPEAVSIVGQNTGRMTGMQEAFEM